MKPADLEIRAARFGEERAMVELYEWLFEAPGERPAGFSEARAERAIAEAIASREATILLADERGQRVGLCSAYLDLNSVRFGRRVWVEDLVVHPERRSRGIGAALLHAAGDWGRAHGATHLELDSGTAREQAHRFYEREGPDWTGKQYAWSLER